MAQYAAPQQYNGPESYTQQAQYMQVPQSEYTMQQNPQAPYMQQDATGAYAMPQDPNMCQQELTEEIFDIPSDAYGAAILAIVRDVPHLCYVDKCLVATYNCFFGFGLLGLNIAMQISLLSYVDNFVVNFDVAHVQEQYRGLRENVFSEDQFISGLWDDYAPLKKQYVCAMGMTNSVFYYCCIFCWTLTVMIEVRTNINFSWDVWRMPRCYMGIDQILVQVVDAKTTSESIVALTCCTRLTLFLLIIIPKFGISMYLLWLGCNWLSAAKSFESLVMNCVAMAFVVGTDEMLFNAVLPKSFREEVEALDFMIREPVHSEEYHVRSKLQSYNSSILFLVAACCFVYAYTFYLQEVLPIQVLQMEPVCRQFLATKYTDICDAWQLHLNGKDDMVECYPSAPGGH